MSDVMLFGVLRMPFEVMMQTELSRGQFWQRAQEACDRIWALEKQVEDLQFRLDAALKEYVGRAIKENQSEIAEAGKGANMFPMQNPPIPITWATAEIIYAGYAAMYGRQQSLERMAERGGFGWGEVRIIYQNTKGRNAIDKAVKENQRG